MQAYEELEALGNDCARQLNRLRSRIPAPDKAALDALTSALGPAFDIGVGAPASALGLARMWHSVDTQV